MFLCLEMTSSNERLLYDVIDSRARDLTHAPNAALHECDPTFRAKDHVTLWNELNHHGRTQRMTVIPRNKTPQNDSLRHHLMSIGHGCRRAKQRQIKRSRLVTCARIHRVSAACDIHKRIFVCLCREMDRDVKINCHKRTRPMFLNFV